MLTKARNGKEMNNSSVLLIASRFLQLTRALRLEELGCPPVYYLPHNDADMSLLARTNQYSYCPYEGGCTYYSIRVGETKSENAVWTYERP
jgi:uncharacterized protein (DUF427 family)